MLITARFRRDVLEGTIEELLPVGEEGSQERISNVTVGGRVKRQTSIPGPGDDNLDKTKLVVRSIEELLKISTPGRSDVCESRVEVETPYWAVNSEGSVRAVLNNQEFEQAVHKEICTYVTCDTARTCKQCLTVLHCILGGRRILAPCFVESFP